MKISIKNEQINSLKFRIWKILNKFEGYRHFVRLPLEIRKKTEENNFVDH